MYKKINKQRRMKKVFIFALGAVVFAGVLFTGCVSKKQVATTQQQQSASDQIKAMKDEAALIEAQQKLDDAKAAAERAEQQRAANAAIAQENAQKQAARLAEATEQPCQIYDDSEWFTATGTRRIKLNSINTAATALLRSTQQQLLLKLKSTYKGVVRDYFDQMDMEEGSYAVSHIESAGDRIINEKINETYEVCRKNTSPDEQGYVNLYMAIKISKKAVVDDIVNEISKEKKTEVRFNEKQFRDSAFKVFEQDQNKAKQEFIDGQNQ
jgi:hypothetical protein